MSIFVKKGRVVAAESISLRPVHVAWGLGNGSWTTPPSEDAEATTLINEIGRKIATEVGFVVPDEDGTIVLPSGNYSRSVSPTNRLLVTCNFDFTDAQSSVIREIGVFVGTTVVGGLPGGQTYFVPAQLTSPGKLVHLSNIEPIFRSPAVREYFEFVITF